ncbi:hypothetical protein [Haloechinothrix halophila]|uniref:hypothetical protein n=1 Tax=Haloechinothrix halophila TaxID=1069073 RepID=UPI000404724F|nr:hypothetical protein [Haloechinothrix halophila]
MLQYRDNTGLEVDAVVEAADGRWGAFDVTAATTVSPSPLSAPWDPDHVDPDHVG